MALKATDIDSMNCPSCEEEGAITRLKSHYPRPGWLVGRCSSRCGYDWSAVKLEQQIEFNKGRLIL